MKKLNDRLLSTKMFGRNHKRPVSDLVNNFGVALTYSVPGEPGKKRVQRTCQRVVQIIRSDKKHELTPEAAIKLPARAMNQCNATYVT